MASEKEFTPQELEMLRSIHESDDTPIDYEELPSHDVADGLLMALDGLALAYDKPDTEIDYADAKEAISVTLPHVKRYMEYLEQHYENRMIPVDIEPSEVLALRSQIIDLMKQKGTEAPTSIGTGWRKTLYGKEFQDTLFARGVEVWYPGITKPTETLEIDTPVHITLIEDPDVDHEARHISLKYRGYADSSAGVDTNYPDTVAWYEVVRDMSPDEWRTVIDTTLDALKKADES